MNNVLATLTSKGLSAASMARGLEEPVHFRLDQSVPRRDERALPTFATKLWATNAVCLQRSCCRISMAVLAFGLQIFTIALWPLAKRMRFP
jgi:hypothetical protein